MIYSDPLNSNSMSAVEEKLDRKKCIMSEAVISIQNLSKTFGTRVLKDISFEESKTRVVTIIGSSGSGNQHSYVV